MNQQENADSSGCYILAHVISLLRRDHYTEAIKLIQPTALHHLPNCWHVRLQYILMYESEGNIERAIEIYKAWLNDNQDDADAWQDFAFFLKKHTNAVEEVVNCYKNAVLSDSSSSNRWHSLGSAYMEAKDIDNAIKAYSKALAIDPSLLPARIDLATAYIKARLLSNAEEQINIIRQHTGGDYFNTEDWLQEITDLNIEYLREVSS